MKSRHAPLLICLTGIDGCGKSTQIDLLVERLRQEGHSATKVWNGGRRPLTGTLVGALKRRLRAPRLTPDRQFDPRSLEGDTVEQRWEAFTTSKSGLASRHRVLASLWAHTSLYEHALEIAWNTLPLLMRGKNVISDRYIFRTLVNQAILTGGGVSFLASYVNHPALRMIPRPDLYLLLDIAPEVAMKRKQDIPAHAYLAQRAPLYRWLATATGMSVVNADQVPEDVAQAVWRLVQPVVEHRRTSRMT